MSAIMFFFPLPGTPAAEGYQLRFYTAGSSSEQAVYTDPGLAIAWAQPIVFNADAVPDGPIYLTPTPALKISYQDANDVPVSGYPVDFYSPAAVGS